MKVEICVDNLESVITANQFPIDRIELCSALAVGGLTPNLGFIQQVQQISTIPLALMIRPRAGDFLYSEDEIQIMLNDIATAKQLGIQAVVFGALSANGEIDLATTELLVKASQGMEITFHRAFDLCKDPITALEQLIDLGCHCILTSGQATTAFDGIPVIQQLVKQANGRIQIMAGCGINADNIKQIIEQTQVPEIHFSAKGQRQSLMDSISSARMGTSSQDNVLDIADSQKIKGILKYISLL
ncbi:copper homeostasis protein CutC [Glaesserella parasuis]|uniref:copper homeostasis protein CutC n=1 Tax=Glaesserella parasuis TaxID=738 RepID=UPI000DD2DACE|nr:copper homeostasis protein CutC [Glaesserella parasuis]MDG6281962.1 copper homeostasis protein CutC [Glaesserella parasuis]MDG6325628.1 copper homeostasis protein CutC [Glaesserella parasuis]MDG6342363.1 copper homeostasis protein CutC [Glaesserella parasuis]MDG6368491.1 copper homeostasis protein CutC [Glaesserella parasuis]MDO9924931.1 copper homeostasis protein CutC [Glaesserella parasuis]